jgi:hypothetical protein
MTDQTDSEHTATLHEIPSPPEREDGPIHATETVTIRSRPAQKWLDIGSTYGPGGSDEIAQLIPRQGRKVEIRHGTAIDTDETGLLTSKGPVMSREELYRALHVLAELDD